MRPSWLPHISAMFVALTACNGCAKNAPAPGEAAGAGAPSGADGGSGGRAGGSAAGAAGAAGLGGTNGAGNAGAGGQDWLAPSLWTSLADAPECALSVATEGGRAMLPVPSWAPCGGGCEESPGWSSPATGLLVLGTTGQHRNGTTDIRITLSGLSDGKPFYLVQGLALEANVTKWAVLQRGTPSACVPVGRGHETSSLYAGYRASDKSYLFARWSDGAGPNWTKAPASDQGTIFSYAVANGISYGGKVRVPSSAQGTDFVELDESDMSVGVAAGRGDLAYWSAVRFGQGSFLRAHSPGAAPKTVYSTDTGIVNALATTEERVVFAVGSGAMAYQGVYSAQSIFVGALTADPQKFSVSTGVSVSKEARLAPLHAAGSRAAAAACVDADGITTCSLWIVNLNTGKVTTVPSRPNRAFHAVVAASTSHLVVVEGDSASGKAQRLLRLDAGYFEQSFKGWLRCS